jgi:2-dehydropantoate 2-reductase
VLWLKLAVNCAINPLSALHDCPNGEVPERAGAIFDPLLAELHALLSSEGVSLSLAELRERILAVIRATASNSSSMRQDVLAGRRTEIDFILGHAWRSARQAGLSTPVLDALYLQLQNHLTERGLPRN